MPIIWGWFRSGPFIMSPSFVSSTWRTIWWRVSLRGHFCLWLTWFNSDPEEICSLISQWLCKGCARSVFTRVFRVLKKGLVKFPMSHEWWKIQSLFLLGEGLGHLFEHKSRSIISGNRRTKWATSLKKHVNNSFWYHTLFNESNGANVVKLRLIRQKMDSSTLPINVDTYRYAT